MNISALVMPLVGFGRIKAHRRASYAATAARLMRDEIEDRTVVSRYDNRVTFLDLTGKLSLAVLGIADRGLHPSNARAATPSTIE
ncbi:hypothetical protein ACDY96_36155 [Rhizobium mongolense]|uniref:hypothetical protein n=1 Tax=Rhizobium TaxID=379 RepID=UPI0024B1AB62|nr:hypothetical protein [Rhizobium sp. CC1099]WFU85902.1 hypothetical protein QA644_12055 [Rhizobium sp. CC1099]